MSPNREPTTKDRAQRIWDEILEDANTTSTLHLANEGIELTDRERKVLVIGINAGANAAMHKLHEHGLTGGHP